MNIKRGYEDIKDCHFVACLHSVNDRRLDDNFSIGLPIAFFRVDLTESASNVPMCFMKPVEFTDHERHNMCLHRGVIQNSAAILREGRCAVCLLPAEMSPDETPWYSLNRTMVAKGIHKLKSRALIGHYLHV